MESIEGSTFSGALADEAVLVVLSEIVVVPAFGSVGLLHLIARLKSRFHLSLPLLQLS